MLTLLIFSYIVLNFKNVFGIGITNVEDDYYNSYSDGTAGINLHIRLDHQYENRYYLYTSIEPISTGNVANYGILSITLYYLNDNAFVYAKSIEFGTPLSSYSMDRIFLNLFKNNNLTCYGMIELSVETGGIPINVTINFQLTYIISVSLENYMDMDLGIYVLFFFQFFLYVIVPVVLNLIFRPVFGLHYSEEEIKRDEKYLQYLHDHLKEKRKEELY